MTEMEWIEKIGAIPPGDGIHQGGTCPGDQMLEMIQEAQKEHQKSKHLKYLMSSWTDTGRTCPAIDVNDSCRQIMDGKWPLPGTTWAKWYEKDDEA